MKFLSIIFCVSITLVFAIPPRFDGPDYIYDGSVPIDVGNYGAPNMFDWERDGKKDIITGQFSSGYIRYYANYNTDSDPQFSGFSYLYASGSQIILPSG